MPKTFRKAAVGGTFDHLHAGHEKLLSECAQNADNLVVGVTAATMTTGKPFEKSIQIYEKRVEAVEAYLGKAFPNLTFQITPLTDIYGPAGYDATIQALFVTPDTLANVEKLQEMRLNNGLSRLEVTVVPLVLATDGIPIRSSRIRGGEINPAGVSYFSYLLGQSKWLLPDRLRAQLGKPFGEVLSGAEENLAIAGQLLKEKVTDDDILVSVGDVVTETCHLAGIEPAISVVDGSTQRSKNPYNSASFANPIIVTNPAGTISTAVIRQFENVIQAQIAASFLVEGEEDLLSLPLILRMPLDSIIVYGLPGKGIAFLRIDPALKNTVHQIFDEWTKG